VDVGDVVGDVFGAATSTDNAVGRWDGITGKKLQNSGVIIDDSDNVKIPSITASRLVQTDASQQLNEVANLAVWVNGTVGEIDVTNNGDGTVTASGAGADTSFTFVTDIAAGGSGTIGFQFRTQTATFSGGILTGVSAASAWTDV